MKNTDKRSLLYVVLGLFAVYLIIKWICRLIFGLLDYAIMLALIAAVIWYIRLPGYKKRLLLERAKSSIKYIGRKFDM